MIKPACSEALQEKNNALVLLTSLAKKELGIIHYYSAFDNNLCGKIFLRHRALTFGPLMGRDG